MTTISFTALDHWINNMPKKLTKLSLGDLHEVYLPAQPVLSCRTVDIDLPGTRTYRQKSNLDILEAHQRLIRKLCSRPRISVSAPPRERKVASPRSPCERSANTFNIEVKGRPLTSAPAPSSHQQQSRASSIPQRRPRTTGHVKNVRSLTDCYMVDGVDKDLSAISQSSLELNKKLHYYWNSDKNILSTGKFVRGQKRSEDVPCSIDSWLPFGRAAGHNSEGVINAFASFTNSDEYYNIEGSIGSRVAKQLQKGDIIRIGINGELQTQDLKVKKWNKENIASVPSHFLSDVTNQDVTEEMTEELQTQAEESTAESRIHAAELIQEPNMQEAEETNKQEELVIDAPLFDSSLDDDFEELVISSFDDFQENTTKISRQKPRWPKRSEMPADPVVESSESTEEEVMEAVKLATPLSWSDQCSKSNIKIIHARVSNTETLKPVASETFPVKFEKLIGGNSRPKLAESRCDGYKIKPRSPHNINKEGASKVKVVYMNPVTSEDEDTANQVSVEKINIHKLLEERNKENTAILLTCDPRDDSCKPINMNTDQINPFQPHRTCSSRSEPRTNFSAFYNSLLIGRNDDHSSQLKITPVHSSTNHLEGNLRVLSAGSRIAPQSKDLAKATRPPGKLTPVKPLHRTVAGQGSSIKTGQPQGETKYFKITSQLKITPTSTPVVNLSHRSTILNLSHISAERGTPQDLDYQFMDQINLQSETPECSTEESEINLTNITQSSKKPIPTLAADATSISDDSCNIEKYSIEPQSPSSSAPISIPTADEESVQISIPTVDEESVRISIPTVDEESVPISIPTADEDTFPISIPTADKDTFPISIPTADEESVPISIPTADEE